MQKENKIPHDLEAEISVLNSMIFDKEAIDISYERLNTEDFYSKKHKQIFQCIVELFSEGIAVDFITLNNKLNEKDFLETKEDKEYILKIAESYITSANVEHHIEIVKEKSKLRKLIKISESIIKNSSSQLQPIDLILEEAERNISEINTGKNYNGFYFLKDLMIEQIYNIEKIAKQKTEITGIASGFKDLDNKTAGFQNSDLIVIGARPSMGKTAFMLNIAKNSNVTTAIFSLEMSKEQLVNRMICSEVKLDAQKLRTGKLDDEDWIKIADSVSSLSKFKIIIDDTPAISISEFRAKCRKLKKEQDIKLIIIDYLQLMTSSNKSNRQQEISEISRNLKVVAKELNVPIITAVQLSRTCEQRQDKRPMLSDIRESGAIEQDADLVMFLYRDEYYNPETEKKNIAEVIIGKHRNGATGVIELGFLGKYTKFVDLEEKL